MRRAVLFWAVRFFLILTSRFDVANVSGRSVLYIEVTFVHPHIAHSACSLAFPVNMTFRTASNAILTSRVLSSQMSSAELCSLFDIFSTHTLLTELALKGAVKPKYNANVKVGELIRSAENLRQGARCRSEHCLPSFV